MKFNLVYLVLLLAFLANNGVLFAQNNSQCKEIITEKTFKASLADCDAKASICFPIPLENIYDFDIQVNGQPYQGTFTGCNLDTIIAYSYFTLLGQGNAGPYRLDSWHINGTKFSGNFANIAALVAMMNAWDPQGKWRLIPASNLIVGGKNSSNYSVMSVEQLRIPGTYAQIGYNRGLTTLGTNLSFAKGNHEVIFTDLATDCSDTVRVHVACPKALNVEVDIYENLASVYCLNETDLLGNIVSINNICPSNSGNEVVFAIDRVQQCVVYSGVKIGSQSACIVACDEYGFCDTTYLKVNVLETPANVFASIIPLDERDEKCIDTRGYGTVSSITNVCPASSGQNVMFDIDATNYCVGFKGLTPGTDTACIVICNTSNVCDTLYYIITAVDMSIPHPNALDDAANVKAGESMIFKLLENDSILLLNNIRITEQPQHGKATLNMDFTVTYEADKDFCGTDSLRYEICNLTGCDVATLSIEVVCKDIIVYTGFSPNDDDKNDNFTVEGLQGYPGSMVTIFNRWGNRVYASEQSQVYKNNWNGTWQGKMLPEDTYFYLIELNDEKKSVYSGWVNLRR